ncbi:MAG: hypothetical protein KDC44_20990, partial [Phaeodactylibacter sp.]|nr:hypothetical protein [Phaeodactylibacter sp.]
GNAELIGNRYTGKVSHFSFWNCDDPYTLVTLTGSFLWEGLNPLAFLEVEITLLSTGEVGNGYLNNEGMLTAAVPINEPMTLSLLDGCGNEFYSMPIGPFAANTDIGMTGISADDVTIVPFSSIIGQLTDCDDLPLQNGYLKVEFDNHTGYLNPDVNGVVESILAVCQTNTTIEVEAVDLNNLTYSAPQIFTVDDMIDIGTIQACEAAFEEYVLYVLDGQPYQIVDYMSMHDSLGVELFLGAEGNGNNISIHSPGSGLGTHAVDWLSVNSLHSGQSSAPDVTITITAYPAAIGETWEGSFEGEFLDQQSTSHTLSGSFKIIREF